MAEEFSPFGHIPAEVASEIFDLIPIRDKKRARLVCHRWQLVIDNQDSVAFRPKIVNLNSFKHFLKSCREMDHVILRNIKKRMPKLTNPELPVIKTVELGWNNSQGNIVKFLKEGCEFAESLTIAKYSLERISRSVLLKIIPEIDWTNLTRLKIIVVMTRYKDLMVRKHLGNVIAFMKSAQIQTLVDFDFDIFLSKRFPKKMRSRFRNLMLGIYKFVAGHTNSLKILSGQIVSLNEKRFPEIPEIPADLETSIAENIKLKCCTLAFSKIRRLEFLVKPTFFGSELSTFNLCVKGLEDPDLFFLYPFIGQILNRNGGTLKTIFLDVPDVNMGWFRRCSVLEVFKYEAQNGFLESEGFFLPQIQLKVLSARGFWDYSILGMLQLLRQSAGTLEHLAIHGTPRELDDDPARAQFWFLNCTALKFLRIVRLEDEFMEQSAQAYFPLVTEFETSMASFTYVKIVAWTTRCMPNLERITILGPYRDVPALWILLNELPRLKRITLELSLYGWTREDDSGHIRRFCERTPGLSMSTTGHRNRNNEVHVIEVDRSRFNRQI